MGKKKAFLESFRDLLSIYNITRATFIIECSEKEFFTIDPNGENIKVTINDILKFCGFIK